MLNAKCGFTYNTDADVTGAKMWSTYYQMTVTQLIQESLVKLCVEHVPWSNTLEIDGIVCIARGDDSKQLVVKIHQVLDVTSQKESKHITSKTSGDIEESHVDAKVEYSMCCHNEEQTGHNDGACNSDTIIDAVETHSPDAVNVSGRQLGNHFVSIAPTTPIWKWHSSSPSSHSPLEPQFEPDVDSVNDDDIDTSQPGDKELVCKKCGATYRSVSQLQSHTAKVHSRYMCKHCLNTFSLRCNLRRHERLHAGLKPYSCDVCSKSFARSTDLKIHLARHSIGQSITCSQCPKTFTGLSSLRWHMYKTHQQQDAVHQCNVCGQVLFDRIAFQAHLKLHVNSQMTTSTGGDTTTICDTSIGDMSIGDTSIGGTAVTNAAVGDKVMDREVTEEEGNDGMTVSATCPAMVSILKMNATHGSQHNMKQDVSVCAYKQLDKFLECPVVSHPPSQAMSPSQSNSTPAVDNGTTSDTGKRLLTQLLMTAADASRSKRRKGLPVKRLMSPVVMSSDSSDGDMSDVSGEHVSKCWDNGTDEVGAISHLSLSSPRLDLPQSASPDSHNTQTVVCDVQSVTTAPALQPVDTDVQAQTEVTGSDTVDQEKSVNATELKGYICNHFNCGNVFVGFSKYELHYIEKHDRYPCHFCDNSFTGKNNRIRHEKSHTAGKSYQCKDCARMFSRPDSLREHQFTHTASYREQKCRICGATYDKKAQLLSHMKKCFRGMRIVDYSTDSVEVRLPKRGKKEDDHSTLLDGFMM